MLLSQTEQDQNLAGSIWLPGREVCRKLQGSGPDCARQYWSFPLFTKQTESGVVYIAQSGQLLPICLVWCRVTIPLWLRSADARQVTSSHLLGEINKSRKPGKKSENWESLEKLRKLSVSSVYLIFMAKFLPKVLRWVRRVRNLTVPAEECDTYLRYQA